MSGTGFADLAIEQFRSVAGLPNDAAALFDAAGSLFETRSWWNVTLSHAVPREAQANFIVVRFRGRVGAIIPMLCANGQLSSLTTPYTCLFRPLIAEGLDRDIRIAVMAGFAYWCRGFGVVRLDALAAEWASLGELECGVGRAGLVPLRFAHFGNWSEDVAGITWSAYLRRRPGALRETVRRRLRRAEELPDARFELLTRPDQMDMAAAAFESVHRRSWKDVEPYPDFNVGLMRAAATNGWLRLGVWSIGAEAVAVQFWIVWAGDAIVLKLAHDEAFKRHSPGTVLTALMLRHLIDEEHVRRIDFGRGDDAYKQGWATERRQRVGLLLVNPWRVTGLAALLRQTAGRLRGAFGARPGRGAACGRLFQG